MVEFKLSKNAALVYGILMTSGIRTVPELVARTQLSQPGVSRALKEISQTGRLRVHRQGRQFYYALARTIRSLPVNIQIQRITEVAAEMGSASLLGDLVALEGGGYLFVTDGQSERFDGLPWFLQDMRPQGYVGRAFCHAHAADLGLSERLADWTDDDVIYALSAFGEDSPGNLIVGNLALRRYLSTSPEVYTSADDLAGHYDAMADAAVQGAVPGSSAGGEHPKFLTRYRRGEEIRNVIVKFSPVLDGTPAAARWKDLLIAEHVASTTLARAGVAIPDSRIIISGKRCYLESLRYDRVGLKGRVATVSMAAIDDAFLGVRRSWSESASLLRAQDMIDSDCEARIKLLERFGRGIANTDMHSGNLSFFWQIQDGALRLRLTPVYDMLPMLYAPEKTEVVDRAFHPPVLTDRDDPTLHLAREFWTSVASRDDVSQEFRAIAAANAAAMQ